MTDYAHPRTPLEKFHFPAGETTVVDELVADGTPGPTPAQHGLVPVKAFLTDLAQPGLDPQQHRFPVAACLPNAHQREYNEALRGNTRRSRS